MNEERLRVEQDMGNLLGMAATSTCIACAAGGMGNNRDAMMFATQSVALARQSGDRSRLCVYLNLSGAIARRLGDDLQATLWCDEAVMVAKKIRHDLWSGCALHTLGYLALHQQEPARAIGLFEESIAVFQTLGDSHGVASSLAGCAAVLALVGHPLEAVPLLSATHTYMQGSAWRVDVLDRNEYVRTIVAVQARLNEAEWDQAWVEGQAMTLEQAVAFALEVTHSE